VTQRVSSSSPGVGGFLSLPGSRPPRPVGLASLVARVRARLGHSRLDRALAAGADPCASLALAYRASRLTSRRRRLRLANEIDKLLDAAAAPPRLFALAVEPDREEVAAALPQLIELSELLRSSSPLYSQGLARLLLLLRDGGGPIYAPARQGALGDELLALIAALEGREEA
jgi:hypothetical protein